jgi:hypothetical protein
MRSEESTREQSAPEIRDLTVFDFQHIPLRLVAGNLDVHVEARNSTVLHEKLKAAMFETPKLAICFFGLVKEITNQQIESFELAVLKPLRDAGYQLDGFLHTFNMTGEVYANPLNLEEPTQLDQLPAIQKLEAAFDGRLEVLVDTFADADRHFGPHEEFLTSGDPWPSSKGLSVKYYLRQLYSLLRLTSMWSKVDLFTLDGSTIDISALGFDSLLQYDGVMYMRPDTSIETPLPVRVMSRFFGHPSRTLGRTLKKDVVVPRFEWGGLYDQLAFGSVLGMLVYGARGLRLRDFVKAKGLPHPQNFLFNYLCENNVSVHLMPVRARADGRVDERRNLRRFLWYDVHAWNIWVRDGFRHDQRLGKCVPESAWPLVGQPGFP